MGTLTLKGTLDLKGMLTLQPSGGKVMIDTLEALVQVNPAMDGPQCSSAPPVMLPPAPAGPTQPQPTVWIVTSFNQTVKAGTRPMVAQGMVMQGLSPSPMWPGMVLQSTGNPTVKANGVPINVVGDKATIFPSGGMATLGPPSGQP